MYQLISGTFNLAVSVDLSMTQCLSVYYNPNGRTGLILYANIRPTDFDIILTQVGTGLDITSQFFMQEK